MRILLCGCVVSVTLACLFQGEAAAVPLLEFQFNETGTTVQSSGSVANEYANTYYGFLGQVGKTSVDLHTAAGTGVGGDLVGNVNYGIDRALQCYYGEVYNPDTQSPSTVQVIALNETSTAVSALSKFTVSGWYKLNNNEDAALLGGTPFFQAPGSSAVFNSQGFAVRAQWDGDIRVTANSYQFSNQLSSDVQTFEPKGVWVYFAVTYDGTSSVDNVKVYQGFRNAAEAAIASQQVGVTLNPEVTLMDTLTIDSGPIEASFGYSMLGRMVESDKINNPGVYDSVYHWQDAIYDNMRVDGDVLQLSSLESYRSTDAFGTPAVPEPSSLALAITALSCGIASCIMRRRRRG